MNAELIPPPCFFSRECGNRAEVEREGKSVCRACVGRLCGANFPLRAPSRKRLYANRRLIETALDMSKPRRPRRRRSYLWYWMRRRGNESPDEPPEVRDCRGPFLHLTRLSISSKGTRGTFPAPLVPQTDLSRNANATDVLTHGVTNVSTPGTSPRRHTFFPHLSPIAP